jgi:hypothetical protein
MAVVEAKQCPNLCGMACVQVDDQRQESPKHQGGLQDSCRWHDAPRARDHLILAPAHRSGVRHVRMHGSRPCSLLGTAGGVAPLYDYTAGLLRHYLA